MSLGTKAKEHSQCAYLAQSDSKGPAGKRVQELAAASNTWMVHDDLVRTVNAAAPHNPREPRHVGRWLSATVVGEQRNVRRGALAATRSEETHPPVFA